ncbi:hypothetical protein ZWY2020_028623 [Hordeum vulgare]|nr:hypothetical protein ZWY2020_028623 [Hordeum vulgare]
MEALTSDSTALFHAQGVGNGQNPFPTI